MDKMAGFEYIKRRKVPLYLAAAIPLIRMLVLIHQYLFANLSSSLVDCFLIPALIGIFMFCGFIRQERCIRILTCYLLWLLFTRFINGDHALSESMDSLLYASQSVLVFIPGILLDKEDRNTVLTATAFVVTVFYLFLGVLSIYVGVTHLELINPLDGYRIGLSASHSRIYLLGLHPNVVGGHYLIAFCMAVWLFFRFDRALIKAYALTAGVVFVIVIAQTVSRNAQTCLSMAVGLSVGILAFSGMGNKQRRIRIAALFGAAVLMGTLFYFVFEPIRYLLWEAYERSETVRLEISENMTDTDSFSDLTYDAVFLNGYFTAKALDSENEQEQLNDSFQSDSRAYFDSGRKEIYWSAIKSLEMEPRRLLVGSSWEHLLEISHSLIREQAKHFHNDFLQAVNLFGLPGMILQILFLVCVARFGIRTIFDVPGHYSVCDRMLVIPVAVFYVYIMLECTLNLKYIDFRALMFYFLAGMMVGAAKQADSAGANLKES